MFCFLKENINFVIAAGRQEEKWQKKKERKKKILREEIVQNIYIQKNGSL